MKTNPMYAKAMIESRLGSVEEDLREAERFFEWALDYERKGLKIAADAMRDEGRKSFSRYLESSSLSGALGG